MKLETTELGNLTLDANVSTSQQICSYVEGIGEIRREKTILPGLAGKGKGFYGVCDFGDVLILGTYGSGIYYMVKSTSEIRKGELVGVGGSCVVDGEAVELGGKDAEVASFDASICKNITKVSETKAVAAIVYNKNNSDHYDKNHLDIVESEDGMRWEIGRAHV